MIDVNIIGSNGTGKGAKVNGEGELSVVVHPHPPIDEDIFSLPFRSYFLNGISNDMIVNGATTNVDFTVEASQDYDIYIKTISVVIGDSGSPTLLKFGALAALSNGVGFIWKNDKEGEFTLHEGITTNQEFVRLGLSTGAVGTGSDSWLSDVSGGASTKSYLPIIDMALTYGMPYGIRLVKGSTDKLIFRIKDALAGLDTFNAIAYGIRI